MRYPVAYRASARKYNNGGFQEPAVVPPRGPYRDPMKPPYTAPPKPANDPYPRPDNDNVPGRGRWEHPPFPKLPSWPGFPPGMAEAALGGLLPPQARRAWELGRVAYQFYGDFPDYNKRGEVETPAGWQQVCGPSPISPGYNLATTWAESGNQLLCGLVEQALPGGINHPLPQWNNAVFAKSRELSPGLFRWAIISQYHKNSANAERLKYHVPVMPSVFPHHVPNPVPATVANPVPAYVAAPVGNALPAARPFPGYLPKPGSGIYEAPPRLEPAKWPQGGKVGAPLVVVAPPTVSNPIRKPPGPGVKERKFRNAPGIIVGALGAASGIYEDAKFANDILNAWYNSLPGRGTARTPAEKALELYRRADEINIEKAIKGTLWAIASEKAGAYIDRARRVTGDNLGLNMYISIPTGSAPRV